MTKTLSMNKDNDELKEDSEITNWSELAKAVDDAKNKTGKITITLGNGIYTNNKTIVFNNPNATITINGNGQTIDGNQKKSIHHNECIFCSYYEHHNKKLFLR